MSTLAVIDAYTGPGHKSTTVQAEVQELTFRLKKRTVEIIHQDGSMGQYDLAKITDIQIVSDGDDFTVAITSGELSEEMKSERAKADESNRIAAEWRDKTGYGKESTDRDTIADNKTSKPFGAPTSKSIADRPETKR